MPRAPLPCTIRFTLPFALLALLAGCSSSNSDDAPEADASSDAPITTHDGDVGPDGTIVSEAGDDANPSSDDGGGDDTSDAGDASLFDAGRFDSGTFDAASGHVLAAFPTNDSGDGWERATPIANGLLAPLNAVLAAQDGGAGSDQWANLSRDGASIAFVTTRFHCVSGDCLAIAASDGSKASLVKHSGEIVPNGRPAIASGSALIVYPSNGGAHPMDLYAIKNSGGTWGAPTILTSAMTEANAHDVAISYDGAKVVFDCGPTQYQNPGTDICVANTDGSGTTVLIAHTAGPGAGSTSATHHPDFAPDGTIVFEADWGGTERIWRFTGPSTFALVSPSNETNDNSPCVLPDGRVASLWLNRPGNAGSVHELKVMNSDGGNTVMVVIGLDIFDTGQSCGN